MNPIRAEIISIGDEITSGVRLDTNTQWLSSRLGDLGIEVVFHTTVGDSLDDMINVFKIAATRVDFVLVTGGLGPTADDLTRQAIANAAGVELFRDDQVLEHIKQMYQTRGREMPPNNVVQSMFPTGSNIIPNPEGTAPGIDFEFERARVFALPGVPVEMKQMFAATVGPALKNSVGHDLEMFHHTIHCFGSGESHIETLLPNLIERGRDPQVGITASSATISLRISSMAKSKAECDEKMRSTIESINSCLGELVYGENGIELNQVVVAQLASTKKTVAVLDAGLHGAVANLISQSDTDRSVLVAAEILVLENDNLLSAAKTFATKSKADYCVVIGPVNRDPALVDAGESFYEVAIVSDAETDTQVEAVKEIRFSGHSGWREIRAVKEVLNHLRLTLRNQ